jgi:class 3 adenylate cyclase/CHASE2 domain-containing sensor protein
LVAALYGAATFVYGPEGAVQALRGAPSSQSSLVLRHPFCFVPAVKLKPFKLVPGLLALGVILLVSLLRVLPCGPIERLEGMAYDMRVRGALGFTPTVATNLGFVAIDEDSVRAVGNRSLGYSFGLLWPRQVYGRLVHELSAQGAKAVALDILTGELRPDHAPVYLGGTNFIESDEFFAEQMQQAGNVIVAQSKELSPPPLFATHAFAVGDITTEKDADGVLRRVQVYRTSTNWHAAFRQVQAELGFSLAEARVEPRQVVLHRQEEVLAVPLDPEGNFDLADFGGDKLPPGLARHAKPFTLQPVWHMGVLLGARELGLDLAHADIDLPHGRITLRGPGGIERRIPVDQNGYAYVDWCLPPNHPQLTQEAIEDLLRQYNLRLQGKTAELTNRWRGKLAVVGSSAQIGNNLTDRGATPLFQDTLLVSKHWNVANSLITGRFVQRSSLAVDLGLIALLGLLAAVMTWELRVLVASGAMVLLTVGYIVAATVVYVQTRLWLPIILPVFGALLLNHVCLVTWRVVFEQAARRHVKAVLSTIVSPKVAHVLLQSEKLSLAGERREITVMFADVRGFTQFTDTTQEQAAEFVRQHKLTDAAAEACFDERAREALNTVNLYLGLVADTVLNHEGTLDKFIGDCVMVFWGAPNPQPKHALACVRAAIAAQRAIHELNLQRAAENKSRAQENGARAAAGLLPQPLLPLLQLGTGINSGMATAGLMGSEVKTVVRQANYTVFGREVNIASRLESLSGRGRIFISEATYQQLLRDEPTLAATCVAQEPTHVKGIAAAIKVYEVPWRLPGTPVLEELSPSQASSDATSLIAAAKP